ncbi:hypothetical protein VaNZ11_004581 [Volvox africanus]|uniref:F-box domain-containing protein n=1 Tax=Volvox africanus TaxID=51714 RepID=A0ABQ5RWQ3_9CHLO|nr:hypothetical protein VaNZ11_004581 [Volvox africanus]
MAERRAGGPAGMHQAATAAINWQQVLNATAGIATSGIAASGGRGPTVAPELGQFVALAAPRGAFQSIAGQRHQFGSAGRAALHMARQIRPEQLQMPGAIEAQVLQMYQLGLNESIQGFANLQHQQQQQHQQYHRQQVLQHQQGGHIIAAVPLALGQPGALSEQHQILVAPPGIGGATVVMDSLINPLATGIGQAMAVGSASQHLQTSAHRLTAVVVHTAAELQQQRHQQQRRQQLGQALLQQQQQMQQQQHLQLRLQLLQQVQQQQNQVQHPRQHQQQLLQQQQQQQQQQLVQQQQQQQEQQQQQQQLVQQQLALNAQPPVQGTGPQQQAVIVMSPPQPSQSQSRPQPQPFHHHTVRAVRPVSAGIAFSTFPPTAHGGADSSVRSGSSSGSSARVQFSRQPLGAASNSSPAQMLATSGVGAVTTVTLTSGPGGCGGDSSATDLGEDIYDPYDGGSSDGGGSADSDSEFISPNHPICETASSWASLTAGLLARVMAVLAASGALPALAPALRRVCCHWRSVVDAHLDSLSPNIMKVRAITTRFTSLRSLHLDRCANIRNRDLLVLSRAAAAQHLHTLTLGDDRARPWVSNRGLASVCRITTLTRLTLRDCMSLTNRGLMPLSALMGLTCLSLRGCRKLTNQGVEALRGLHRLQHLSLYGVVRLSDKGLVPLAALPDLRTLELGHTRVRDEGLGHAARLSGLRALVLVREEVSDGGVRQLSALSGLTRLVLRDTAEVSGETLAVLLPALKELQVLDIQRNWSFNNMQLARVLPQLIASSCLTTLDLRATWVCDEGIAALARISSLRRLAISPQHEHWCKYLPLLLQLQQLTALVLRSLPSLPYQLIDALAALPNLRELDVSDPPPVVEGVAGWAAAAAATAAAVASKEPLRPYTIAALTRLRGLRHLDLSRRNLLPDQALFLAMFMPSLERLFAVHCPLPLEAVGRMWQQKPQLVVVAGSGTAAMHCLISLQQQMQQQKQQHGGQQEGARQPPGSAPALEVCLLPPLDDADGFFAFE